MNIAEFLGVLAVAGIAAMAVATVAAALLADHGFPLPPDDRRIGCIDGLRGYIALAVMIHHFALWCLVSRTGAPWGQVPYDFLNQLGAAGVALFFMVTGLVFYPRIQTGLVRTFWPAVYVSRLFRIVPLVTLSVVLVTLILMARTGRMPGPEDVRPALKWITTFGESSLLGDPDSGRINAYVLWSLNFEWRFYLAVLPLCALLADVLRLFSARDMVLPLLFLALAVLADRLESAPAGSISFYQFLPFFGVGMLAYACQARATWREFLSRPLMGVVAVCGLLAGMMLTRSPHSASFPLFAFFFICVACGNSLGGLLRLKGALVLGECSFGIYLLHGLLLDVAFVDGEPLLRGVRGPALPVLLPLLAAAAALTAALSYRLVERPAIAMGRQVARRMAEWRFGLPRHDLKVDR